ncbi:MAG: tRNA (adenosine(37)-N6)-threonylcarbamoyltransferase complex ATPase subunit type 1 TsaE [Actinobacteria bacterium]|nr:tRNA (adenosine(37)-N6)-threonylcarbamoyltransferase complex ATPase subunit type 1 TsaE [Actinomycetota bacterium]
MGKTGKAQAAKERALSLVYFKDLTINSASPQKTKEAGRLFARILEYGDVVLLGGELGAGKTTFISGTAAGLGIDENLSSPSFTILNIYTKSKLCLVHADFYRLDGIDDILNTGIEQYLGAKNTLTFIEWGEKIKDFLKKDFAQIYFEYNLLDKNARTISIKGSGPAWGKKIIKLGKLLKNAHFGN